MFETAHDFYYIIRKPWSRMHLLKTSAGRVVARGSYKECLMALDEIKRGGLGKWNKQRPAIYPQRDYGRS